MTVYLIAILLAGVNAIWLPMTLLMLPGNWLMVLTAALVAWWQWDQQMISPWTILVVVVLALLGELLELLASATAVRRAGGTRLGSITALLGAILGGLVGTLLLPIPLLGSLVGACGGAAAGALLGELASGRTRHQSLRSGMAAGRGALFAIVGKFAIGVLIWGVIAVAAFWP